jgi:hypothetical protein
MAPKLVESSMIHLSENANIPLLLHENVVRGVINNVGTENSLCHMVVSSGSRRQVLLAVEDELVAVGSQTSSDSHTSHFECEDIAIFLLAILKKFDRLPVS